MNKFFYSLFMVVGMVISAFGFSVNDAQSIPVPTGVNTATINASDASSIAIDFEGMMNSSTSLAWHYSHGSHVSHGSHGSHVSHYSSRY